MMNTEIKAAWITALKSGEYSRGVGNLRVEQCKSLSPLFCCLGVLTDLGVQAGIGEWETGCSNVSSFTSGGYDDDNELHPAIQEWSGVDSYCGELDDDLISQCTAGSLIDLNDEAGLSFDQIADVINYFM